MSEPLKAEPTAVVEPEIKQFASPEEIAAAIKGSKELTNEYAELLRTKGDAGEAEFLEKYLKKADAAGQEEPPKVEADVETGKEAENEAGAEDGEMTPREKELLNQLESLRGSRSEIETKLRDEQSARKNLERAIEESKQKTDEALKAPLPEDINISDLEKDLENVDLLDADGQKKLVGTVIGTFKKLVTGIKARDSRLAAVEGVAKNAETNAVAARNDGIVDSERDREIAEIEALRRANPDLFSKRPLTELEDDFSAFMHGLAKITGFKGEVSKDGIFAPEVQEAYRAYHDKEKGKELKEKAEKAGVKLPDDFDDLVLVHQLRMTRKELMEETGGTKMPSFRRALEIKIASQPAPESPKLALEREKRAKDVKAEENRAKFAKELPPDKGSSPVDITKISEEEFKERIDRYNASKDPTLEDRQWLEAAMKATGFKDAEIETALQHKKQRKKG